MTSIVDPGGNELLRNRDGSGGAISKNWLITILCAALGWTLLALVNGNSQQMRDMQTQLADQGRRVIILESNYAVIIEQNRLTQVKLDEALAAKKTR